MIVVLYKPLWLSSCTVIILLYRDFYCHTVHNCDYRIVQTFVVIMLYSDYTFYRDFIVIQVIAVIIVLYKPLWLSWCTVIIRLYRDFIVIQYIAVIVVLYKPFWLSWCTVIILLYRDFIVIQYITVIIVLYKPLWLSCCTVGLRSPYCSVLL